MELEIGGEESGTIESAAFFRLTIGELITFNTVAQKVLATLAAAISLVATIPTTSRLGAGLAGPVTQR